MNQSHSTSTWFITSPHARSHSEKSGQGGPAQNFYPVTSYQKGFGPLTAADTTVRLDTFCILVSTFPSSMPPPPLLPEGITRRMSHCSRVARFIPSTNSWSLSSQWACTTNRGFQTETQVWYSILGDGSMLMVQVIWSYVGWVRWLWSVKRNSPDLIG